MKDRWHLHAMVVHAVVGLGPLAAAAAVAAAAGRPEWDLPARLGVGIVAVAALAGTVTGVAERDRSFATWLPTHRWKLALSAALLAGAATAAAGWPWLQGWERAAAAVAVGGLAVALAHLGIRITLGRHRLVAPRAVVEGGDALSRVRERLGEPPRVVDPTEEVPP